jgi:uridine kinase
MISVKEEISTSSTADALVKGGEHVPRIARSQPWFPHLVELILTAQKSCAHKRFHIAVAGESGSGKTTLAYSLIEALSEYPRLRSAVLKIDDYFFLPPQSNHKQRLIDISHVGPQEVDLARLDENLAQSWAGASQIISPVKSYLTDSSGEEIVHLEEIQCIFIEGTYSLMVQNLDYRIFIDRPFFLTFEDRLRRGRDTWALENKEWNEKLLGIEHEIISKTQEAADVVITREYSLIARKLNG